MLFSKKTALIATAAILGGSAHAQLGGLNLSGSCQTAAIGLLFGDLNSCLGITSGLLPLFTSSSGSIVGPLDNYLNQNICGQNACSEGTITSANQTLNDNCQEDIQSGSTLIVGLQTILEQYPTVREAACLQAAGNNTRCVTQSLYGLQNATGQQIDLSFLTGLLSGNGNTSLSDLASVDSSVVCTNCNKALYLVASENSNSNFTEGAVARAIDQKCGSGFTSNTTFPSDVNNPVDPSSSSSAPSGASSTPAATSTGGQNAAGKSWSVNGLTALAAGAMGLGVVGGAFGVLA